MDLKQSLSSPYYNTIEKPVQEQVVQRLHQHQQHQPQNLAISQTIAPILPWRRRRRSSSNSKSSPEASNKMDLMGWNFDPSMLNSLINDNSNNNTDNASSASSNDNNNKGSRKRRTAGSKAASTSSDPEQQQQPLDSSTTNNWDGNLNALSNFGGLEYEGGGIGVGGSLSSQRSHTADGEEEEGDGGDNNNNNNLQQQQFVGNTQQQEGGAADSTLIQGPQLHPMAMQSSATCPPTNGGASSSSNPSSHHHLQMQQQHGGGGGGSSLGGNALNNMMMMSGGGRQQQQQQQPTNNSPDFYALGGIDSAAIASLAASFQNTMGSNSGLLNSLAANFLLAQVRPPEVGKSHNHQPPANTTAQQQQHQQQQNQPHHPQHHHQHQHQHQRPPVASVSTSGSVCVSQTHSSSTGGGTTTTTSGESSSAPATTSRHHTSTTTSRRKRGGQSSSSQQQQQQAEQGGTNQHQDSHQHHHHPSQNHHTTSASNSSSPAPPFYLFDAPVELRANFMQNQKRLGLPIQHDPNSYHFGETVKGFHPQQLMNQQQLSSMMGGTNTTNNKNNDMSSVGAGGSGHVVNHIRPDVPPVKLIDARHGYKANLTGQVKNEREQKRAQKITELIDQLRLDMEKGGWKVELRSKFHTLTQCAEYVKHMVETTKTKEKVIETLKSDLEVRKRKLEDDKSAQESRSDDPESSVISSLTSDTNGTRRHHQQHHNSSRSNASNSNNHNKKQKLAQLLQPHQQDTSASNIMSSVTMNEDSSGGGDSAGTSEDRGAPSSSESRADSGSPSPRGSSIGNKTDATGVSDITDSNRASSSTNTTLESGGGCGKTEESTKQDVSAKEKKNPGEQSPEQQQHQPSISSISSDAAVASIKSFPGNQLGEHQHNHKDVVVDHAKRPHHKRPHEKTSPLERNASEVDYKEIFKMSNVPQLIATTSGKIVTWNQCFLKATGIRRSEVERMTIFSLVKAEMLGNFFEIVAHALKDDVPESEGKEDSAMEATATIESNQEAVDERGDKTIISESEEGASSSAVSPPSRTANYAAMTLPCIEFPAMKKRRVKDGSKIGTHQLHVTITLMPDEDPRKRCFHCVFTNSPGTNGALGIITPDLLEALFSTAERPPKKVKRHHRQGRSRSHKASSGSRKTGKEIEIPSSIQKK